jgi:hypothetical protein
LLEIGFGVAVFEPFKVKLAQVEGGLEGKTALFAAGWVLDASQRIEKVVLCNV